MDLCVCVCDVTVWVIVSMCWSAGGVGSILRTVSFHIPHLPTIWFSVRGIKRVGRWARCAKINRFAVQQHSSMQMYTDKRTSSVKLSFAQIFLCSLRGKFIALHGVLTRSLPRLTRAYPSLYRNAFLRIYVDNAPASQSESASHPASHSRANNNTNKQANRSQRKR